MPDKSAQTESQKRADNNQRKKISAHRCLDRLLHVVTHADFDGTVTLVISGREGYATKIRSIVEGNEKD